MKIDIQNLVGITNRKILMEKWKVFELLEYTGNDVEKEIIRITEALQFDKIEKTYENNMKACVFKENDKVYITDERHNISRCELEELRDIASEIYFYTVEENTGRPMMDELYEYSSNAIDYQSILYDYYMAVKHYLPKEFTHLLTEILAITIAEDDND